jgi:DNA-binding response OmpR family regulator
MKKVLLADNDAHFLNTRARFLQREGYEVIRAFTLQEAEQILSISGAHLAVLDIRLVDDDDDKDISGLTLAKREEFRSIPKIILTRFPSYEGVREALIPRSGAPAAIDYVGKGEGVSALITAVNKAFSEQIKINSDLVIQSDVTKISFVTLAHLLEPDIQHETLTLRSNELDDLFRRSFFDKVQIRIDRVVWQQHGRIAVIVFAFANDNTSESFVLVCGLKSEVANEAARYKRFAPPAPNENSSVLVASFESVHFGVNMYALAGADFENIETLKELFARGPEKLFSSAVTSLFEKTLSPWHREKPIVERIPLAEVYKRELGLSEFDELQAQLYERQAILANQAQSVGPSIEVSRNTIDITFNNQVFSYPNPATLLEQLESNLDSVLEIKSPGGILTDTVLVDQIGRTWLTDFASAGLLPALFDFISLESEIRFDHSHADNVQWLHEMERLLSQSDFTRLGTSEVEFPLRKVVRAIKLIRRQLPLKGSDHILQYEVGLLFHAIRRLVNFNPAYSLTPVQVIKLLHVMIAAAVVSEKLTKTSSQALVHRSGRRSIRIDKNNKKVWIGKTNVPLTGQSYNLLCYLYENEGRLIKRQEIIENVFVEGYRSNNHSQISKVNTAIRRLREKIEVDADRPAHIMTQQGGGYRFTRSPIETS